MICNNCGKEYVSEDMICPLCGNINKSTIVPDDIIEKFTGPKIDGNVIRIGKSQSNPFSFITLIYGLGWLQPVYISFIFATIATLISLFTGVLISGLGSDFRSIVIVVLSLISYIFCMGGMITAIEVVLKVGALISDIFTTILLFLPIPWVVCWIFSVALFIGGMGIGLVLVICFPIIPIAIRYLRYHY